MSRYQRAALTAAFFLCLPASVSASMAAAEWQADLQYLASHLKSTHPNLFFHVSAQDFNAAVDDLNQRIPQLSDDQVKVGLMKLAAMVGDAHTSVLSPFLPLPIRFRWFSDGLFVNAAAPEYSRALGAKVIEIGDLPVDEAYGIVSSVISHENDNWVREVSETYLATSEILASLGVSSGPGPVRYLLQDISGAQFEMLVAPSSSNLLWPPDSTNGSVPLWRQNSNLNYWFQYLPTTQAIYLAYNRCQDMPGASFAAFLNQVLAFMRQQPVNRIIVDLRNNTGGDSRVFQPMLDALAGDAAMSRKVTAIIGRATISSGIMAAAPLSYQFGIPLIGEPTGGDPNSYGNNSMFNLPNSGLNVSCSTRYYTIYPGNSGNTILPDVPVPMSSADYFARYDPFLAAALAQPATFHAPQPGSAAEAAVNGASFGSPISPGGWATVFGNFSGVATASAASPPYQTSLGGVQVQVNGVPAPLSAVSASQINFQVPSATAPGSAQIDVSVSGRSVMSGKAQVAVWSPGIFLTDFLSLDRPGAILTEDYRLTGPSVRAQRNHVIQIYATGAGTLTLNVDDGAAAPASPLVKTNLLPRVFIGSEEATVEFSGLAPGYVGLWQINARIPDATSLTGQVPLVVVAFDGNASNAVTLWVE